MHPLLSPILDAFLNDNMSPEELADHHKVSIREVLDLLLSEDAANIMRRLTQAEHLRQAVLSARARSKAFSTLDYLTLSDRHSHHKDCDSRRRVSEIILRQTSPKKPRALSAPRAKALPDITSLRAARVASELEDNSSFEQPALASRLPAVPALVSTSWVIAPDPSPLCGTFAERRTLPPHSQSIANTIENLQAAAGSMNSVSSMMPASRTSQSNHASPDDG